MSQERLVSQLQIDFDFLEAFASEQSGQNKSEGSVSTDGTITDRNFTFFSSSRDSVVQGANLTELTGPNERIRQLFDSPSQDDDFLWWLNLTGASKKEIHAICKAFGAHPLTAEDITTQEAREKIELFPSYYFASFRSFRISKEEDGDEYVPCYVYVVVFRSGVLSFSMTSNSHAFHVQSRIAAVNGYIGLSSDWICYALIDDIVDSFIPTIRRIECDADTIEDEVFIIRDNDTQSFFKSMEQARKNGTALLRLIGDKADILRGLLKRFSEDNITSANSQVVMNLGDVQDHVVTMTSNLLHCEQILARAHSNYLATLRINKIKQDVKTNRFLGKITLFASIGVPANLLASIFGMNVFVPWENVTILGPFFGIVGVIVVATFASTIWARWRRLV